MVSEGGGCLPKYYGWYVDLYFTDEGGFLKNDYIVADIHTAPTDAGGAMVGWVVHAGTGPVNLGVFTATNATGQSIAYVGAAMNYREFTTTNFLRLSDEEWKSTYLTTSTRPSFVNLYLADTTGDSRGPGINLIMSPNGVKEQPAQPTRFVLNQNYPNPFNGATLISLTVLSDAGRTPASLKIYTLDGKVVRTLLNAPVQGGNYIFRWDGKDEAGSEAASGMYVLEFRTDNQVQTKKMSLVR